MTPGDQDSYAANAEFWIRIVREKLDSYRTELTDSAVLEAIGPCAGLTVLDGGCGEGYISRHLALKSATVCGIDTSSALITAAQEERDRLGLTVDYHVASLDAIPYADQTFDIVVCNHVMNDVQDPEAILKEIGRVTKPGGRAVFLMLHPCFYAAHTERDLTGGIPASAYFRTRVIHQKFNVAGIESPAEVRIVLRPLEYYTSLLIEHGYVITHLSEPHPSPDQFQQDWWRARFARPLFLLLVGERRFQRFLEAVKDGELHPKDR